MAKLCGLNMLCGFINRYGESFSANVTFFVNGVIISGKTIHNVVYLDEVAKLIKLSEPEMSKSPGEGFKIATDKIREDLKLNNSKGENDQGISDIIFLKDVTIWDHSNSIVYDNGILELRVDSIDGFMWGNFVPVPTD